MSDLSSTLRDRACRIRRYALHIGKAQGHAKRLAGPMCCQSGAAQQRARVRACVRAAAQAWRLGTTVILTL